MKLRTCGSSTVAAATVLPPLASMNFYDVFLLSTREWTAIKLALLRNNCFLCSYMLQALHVAAERTVERCSSVKYV